eukprot:CAMPEP_0172494476 /NCGR_PEP_ID=MMETSP1066-20121228/48921_1 /TAXON_ID=671091 /ORGANISM="Coscinodiscus wailesii, Strain CCMP2513" /LENGTH=112 /DNA_ID=CAMNT_0013265475 /DNA_START=116 /DNA_END=457 /DNA_ORIENTATION=+
MANTSDNSGKILLILISKGVTDRKQATEQARAFQLFEAKGIPCTTVDGMDPAQRERRNELFAISGIRANYPQFFFVGKDGGETTFIGTWDMIEGLNETGQLDSFMEGVSASS